MENQSKKILEEELIESNQVDFKKVFSKILRRKRIIISTGALICWVSFFTLYQRLLDMFIKDL